ncbi:MAG: invasion associated locus B family protein [Alphaproteobacteria bacterium]
MIRLLKYAVLSIAMTLGLAGAAQAKETKFKDWTVTCEGDKACFAQMAGQGPRVIIGWHNKENKIRLGLIVTAKGRIGQPVTVRLDNNTVIYLTVNSCTAQYCEAMARLEDTKKIVTRMQAANKGVVGYLEVNPIEKPQPNGPKEAVSLQLAPLSLAGFSDAFKMVVKKGK